MKKVLSISLLLLFVAAGCTASQEQATNQNSNPKTTESESQQTEQSTPIPTPTFVEENKVFYGTLTLTGYLDVQTRVCNPGDMCGDTVEYASFRFSETDDQDIHKFIAPSEGNSFVGKDMVGIGCYEKGKNRIVYQNDADSGMIEGEIKDEDLELLINSDKNNQVKLTLTREVYTSGRGAPDCYSHFRNFQVSK